MMHVCYLWNPPPLCIGSIRIMDFGPADLFMKPIVQSQQFFFVYLYKHEGGKFNLGNHCKRELSTKSEGDGGGVVTATCTSSHTAGYFYLQTFSASFGQNMCF